MHTVDISLYLTQPLFLGRVGYPVFLGYFFLRKIIATIAITAMTPIPAAIGRMSIGEPVDGIEVGVIAGIGEGVAEGLGEAVGLGVGVNVILGVGVGVVGIGVGVGVIEGNGVGVDPCGVGDTAIPFTVTESAGPK